MSKFNFNIGDSILYPRRGGSDRGVVIDKDKEGVAYRIYWLDWDRTKPYITDEDNKSISLWCTEREIKVYPVVSHTVK